MKPAYCVSPERRTWRSRPRPTAGADVAWVVIESGPEHLVEGVDVGLLVAGRALDRHLQRVLRLVVVLAPRAVAVAGVDEDLVGLLVEERPPVRDEVLRDPGRLLHRVLELEERVLVVGRLDDLLGVDEPDRPLLRIRRPHDGAARVSDTVVGAEVRDPDPRRPVRQRPDDLVVLRGELEDVWLQLLEE